MMLNTGHTPAHHVTYRAKAAILPAELPADFSFPLSDEVTGAPALGPQHNFTLSAMVEDFCDDNLVEVVKSGGDPVLHVWGVVTYDDIFGTRHEASFWHVMTWSADGRILGHYGSRHNLSS
jgi:hypothetical protein